MSDERVSVTPDIFSDRYENLLDEPDGTASELYLDTVRVLRRLAQGTVRRELRDDETIVDQLLDGIQEDVLAWAGSMSPVD